MKQKTSEKKERSLGTKLFLKAERCLSPKCVMIRRPYRPGIHGKSSHSRRTASEFGNQLREKQKVQVSYGLNNRQMRQLFKGQKEKERILESLEKRLDNVVFRLGLLDSRNIARQFINHGHFLVNGRKITTSSYRVKLADKISISEKARQFGIFNNLPLKLKKFEPPAWLKLDKEKLEGEIAGKPEELDLPFDLNLVLEYYSR